MTDQHTPTNPDAPSTAEHDGARDEAAVEEREGGTRDEVTGAMEGNSEAADVALGAVDELAELSSELDRHRARVQELEDQLLRRAAEFQNYRRRTSRELGEAAARGRGEVFLAMIDVLDDLRRSKEAAEQAAEQEEQSGPLFETLKDGVDLVYRKFVDTLRSFGVEPIEAVGEPFDEEQHEALMQQEVEGAASGTVLAEIQKGYRMGDRVLRHARVVVAQ